MGLEQVVAEVERASSREAAQLLDAAKAEAAKILKDAQSQVDAYRVKELARAVKEAEQVKQQVLSSSDFAARKQLLEAESVLRTKLWETLVEGFSNLDQKTRQKHLKVLAAKAHEIIPKGVFYVTPKDAKADLEIAGSITGAGGLICESKDGKLRLDLTYEMLLRDAWRDILQHEAKLFN